MPMKILPTVLLGVAALTSGSVTSARARTIAVEAGEGAQQRLQEALIAAQPGDVVQIGEGRFALTDGLSLDSDKVTLRGMGMERTILDFTGQQGAGEGLLVTSDDVTLRDFAVENAHGDAIKSKGADRIVYYRVRAEWTGGPKETNGAYGIYPVQSTGVLIDGVVAKGASDAGIYVGQSKDITVRYSRAEGNVAGIEIENSRNALVTSNFVTRNTGGILVFDLPNLPVMGGGNVLIERNLVVGNDTPNFAPKGNIVASVRRGTGSMIMANDRVTLRSNLFDDNPTAHVMVVSYPRAFTDKTYNPTPRLVTIGPNHFGRGGYDPQVEAAPLLLQAFGGSLPPVLFDGLGDPATTLALDPGAKAWTLGLTSQGAATTSGRPGLATLPATLPPVITPGKPVPVGAPAALDARIAG
jgi:parallel beta-helix repeat protein